jgi:hypothetical protein
MLGLRRDWTGSFSAGFYMVAAADLSTLVLTTATAVMIAASAGAPEPRTAAATRGASSAAEAPRMTEARTIFEHLPRGFPESAGAEAYGTYPPADQRLRKR